ncbi:cation:proton antiporter [Gilvimarinus sp. F26214L]|uniref:cation:proton antiporter n=1 Tax=Gilvimarinus sp. DZF01 TaxID=3461371 RepID=UPI0040453497
MSELLIWLSWPALIAGLFFFVSGSVGLLRFPDLFTRLHAVTKADTMGFGFVTLGLMLRADSLREVLLLLLVWLLVMASGTTNCQLLARYGESGHPHMENHRNG